MASGIIGDAPLLQAFSSLEAFPSVALAVSGGPDSMALMLLARRWARLKNRDPAAFAVVTIDHRLRAESAQEAVFVGEQARALGFTHATMPWTGAKPKTGVQAAARRARYDLLAGYCKAHGFDCIVTAHTEDDQAETFLMRLRRGSGVDGLAAIAAVSEVDSPALVRPLLGFSKARLTAYLRASATPFIRDPSNENAAFERVRVRHAMNALASAGVTRSSLAMAASRIRRSREALEKTTEYFLDRHFRVSRLAHGEFCLEAFLAQPEDIALRALARALALIGGDREAPRLLKVERLLIEIKSWKAKATLGGCALAAANGKLAIYREPGRLKPPLLPFQADAHVTWDSRLVLTFGHEAESGSEVRQLGAEGWILYKNAMKQGGEPVEANRAAALTTPALWNESRLICAPLLGYFNGKLKDISDTPLNAALAPSLAKFSNTVVTEAASALGKGAPIPYL
jgi:tRNA(Ile)-lysidine synthase